MSSRRLAVRYAGEGHDAGAAFELRPLSPALGAEIVGFDAAMVEAPALGVFLRVAIHDPDLARHFRYGDPIVRWPMRWRGKLRALARFYRRALSARTARHPVIRMHEETGRPSLFLGDHAWRITGCSWRTGARMVEELNTFATTNPEWTYTHAWRVGDLAIWDNRCLLHRASEYDTAREERLMLRAVVEGVQAHRS